MDSLTLMTKNLAESAGWQFFDYSSAEDFAHLWDEVPRRVDGDMAGRPARIVIDWNGAPPGPPSFPRAIEFVTPLDWAVAIAHDRAERGVAEIFPFEVLIVDRCSRSRAGCFADEYQAALSDALQGMRVFSAFGERGHDFLSLFAALRANAQSVDPIASEKNAHSALQRRDSLHVRSRLQVLRDAWLSSTARSRDHHDLNNLLGPLALGRRPGGYEPKTEGVNVRAALHQMIDWLRLSDGPSAYPRNSSWISDTAYEQLAKQFPIDAVVIDDQAELGWAEVVADALGLPQPVPLSAGGGDQRSIGSATGRLHYTTSPAELLAALKGRQSESGPYAERLNLSGGTYDQVIFLDLRLFPRGGDAERRFFADLCGEILAAGLDPRWEGDPHFSSDRLRDADRQVLQTLMPSLDAWLSAHQGDKGLVFVRCANAILNDPQIAWAQIARADLYDCLLTLLPRFVAQVLFTVPIVLFSATGRRDLVEHFRVYGNIITSFEKPRLPVRHDAVVRGFRLAIDNAARLIRARRALRSLTPTGELKSPFVPGRRFHIELYIDEHFPGGERANQDNAWVGGFYAVFGAESKAAAIAKSERFDDALVSSGFTYFSRAPYLPQLREGEDVKAKHEVAYQQLKAALASDDRPDVFGTLRLKNDERRAPSLANSSGDDAYRRAIAAVIETFFCEVLAHAALGLPRDDFTVSVYAGSRYRSVASDHADAARHLQFRFGFEAFPNAKKPGEYMLESLVRSTLYPIIDDISAFRGHLFAVHRALAIRLVYDQDRDGQASHPPAGWILCRSCRVSRQVDLSSEFVDPPPVTVGWDLVQVVRAGRDKRGVEYVMMQIQSSEKHVRQMRETDGWPMWVGKSQLEEAGLVAVGSEVSRGALYQARLGQKLWNGKPNGYQVEEIAEVAYPENAKRRILFESRACPVCDSVEALRPDYPGGLYIADKVVNLGWGSSSRYAEFVDEGPLGFDEELTPEIELLRDAGRALDAKSRVRAAWLAARALQCRPALRQRSLPSRILSRLRSPLAAMNGHEYLAFSVGLDLETEPFHVATGSPIDRARSQEWRAQSHISRREAPDCERSGANNRPHSPQSPSPSSASPLLPASAAAGTAREFPNVKKTALRPEDVRPASESVILSAFRDVSASAEDRTAALNKVVAVTRDALVTAGFDERQFKLYPRLNSKLTSIVCDVVCDSSTATWLCEKTSSDKEGALPWRNAIKKVTRQE